MSAAPDEKASTEENDKRMRERVEVAACARGRVEHGQRHAGGPAARLSRARRVHAGARARHRRQARRAAGRRAHHVLRARRRQPRRAPPVLCVQRRPRLGLHLAAPGRPGSQAARRARRRQHARAAVRGGRQPAVVVRALRPRLHRSAAYGLVRQREREGPQAAPLGGRRRRRAGRGDAQLARPSQALGLAALSGRRELRHDPRRGTGRQAAQRRRRAVRPRPRELRDGPAERRLLAAQ